MMQSKISIEREDESGMPYFKVVTAKDSEDLRDKSINLFWQKFATRSNWAFVDFWNDPSNRVMFIRPITPKELREQSIFMLEQADLLEKELPSPEILP